MAELPYATGTKNTYRLAIGDESFEIGTLKMKACGHLQDWIDGREHPHAVEKVKDIAEGLPPEVVSAMLQEARAEDRMWPPQVMFNTGYAVQAMLSLPGGPQEFLFRVLQQARPDLSESRIKELAADLDASEFGSIADAALNSKPQALLDRRKPEMVLLDRRGVHHLALTLVATMGLEVEQDALRAACDALPLEACGQVVRLAVASDGTPEVPKGEGAARSRRSTSEKPTPS